MKRVLYIDPLDCLGHAQFNLIYLRNLYTQEFQIDVVLSEDMCKAADFSSFNLIFQVNSSFYKFSKSKALSRFGLLLVLWVIFFKVKRKHYDFIIFSSYEEISFFLSPFHFTASPIKQFLVQHNNLRNFRSYFKSFFLHRVLSSNLAIVFESNSLQYLREKGLEAICLPHGMPSKKRDIVEVPLKFSPRRLIFIPSSSSSDKGFVSQLLANPRFIEFIYRENYFILCKMDLDIEVDSQVCKLIKGRLSQDEYDSLFMAASIILLPYSTNFLYRTSAIMLECFVNNKPCLLSNIPSLRAYSSHFRYDAFFNNDSDLIGKISLLSSMDSYYYRDLSRLKPVFTHLFAYL